jgi:hypothetical protein
VAEAAAGVDFGRAILGFHGARARACEATLPTARVPGDFGVARSLAPSRFRAALLGGEGLS